MATSIELAINGLMLGALYALFGLGLSLSLGVMRMINIAHGDVIVTGAYLAALAMAWFGLPAPATLVAVVPAMFLLGWLLQRLLLHRVVGAPPLAPLLLTFGLSIALQNLLQQAFDADTRSLDAGALGLAGIEIGGVAVGVLPLLTALVSIAIYATTHALLARSHAGRQARAVADDPATARLVGIDDRRFFPLMSGYTFAVIGVAAVFYGMRAPFSPSSGPERLLFAFEAVVLGGLGRLWGTFAGGVAIGFAQVVGARIDPALGTFFGHLLFLAVLVARPQGLLTTKGTT